MPSPGQQLLIQEQREFIEVLPNRIPERRKRVRS